MRSRNLFAGLGLVLALGMFAGPTHSETWPGDAPSLGGAIAEKVVGQHCRDVLTPAEITELDAYMARDAEETARKKSDGSAPFPTDLFRKKLTADLEAKYRDPQNCTGEAALEARSMLRRVQKVMASSEPLHPETAKPHVGEVTIARVTGFNCPATFTAMQLAELDLYLAQYWVSLAKSASDADAQLTMREFRKAEWSMENGAKDCSASAVSRARNILARMAKGTNTQ
jgi:hypothetical protein